MIFNSSTTNDIYNTHTESLALTNNTSTSSYIYESLYENYISNTIANEEALTAKINSLIPVNEAAHRKVRVVTEAKLGDTVKSKCNKILDFIKNLFAKFMESMSNLLLNEQDYLKKYEDIIKKKKPKSELGTYTTDYRTAIDRCINLQLPVFNFKAHSELLLAEEDDQIVKEIMKGKTGFTYDSGDTLENMFKNYFMANEDGSATTTKNISDMNFTDLYNFCYNYKKIEEITRKDRNYLEQSTNAILNSIKTEVIANQDNNQNNATTTSVTSPVVQSGENSNEEAAVISYNYKNYFTEGEKKEDGKDNKGGLQINTNAISQMNSYKKRDGVDDDTKNGNVAAAKAKEDGITEKQMLDMTDKWLRICRIIIAAKCTAVQSIAKDYMEIIRAHVRSYVGTKDKTTDQSAKRGTDYSKGNKENKSDKNKNKTPTEEGSGDQTP